MNRGLRRRHRRMAVTLAVVLPAGFAAALIVRPVPPEDLAAVDLLPAAAGPECLLASFDDLWAPLGITTRLYDVRGGDGELRLELQPRDSLRLPDLLVYRAPAVAPAGGTLPAGAILLGRMDGELRVPREGSALLLFSLAHGEVVAAAEVPPPPEGASCR